MPRLIDFTSGAPCPGPDRTEPTEIMLALHEFLGEPELRRDIDQAERITTGGVRQAHPQTAGGTVDQAIRKRPSDEPFQRLSNGRFRHEPKRTVKARHIV